ncbi:MAG: GNAT family N-acetyltransferase [Clostridiales bacterium]|jgi:ribosomal protein S18 acetylase RimI-like enzyme|nr:GNAT family N-acetyltransferase [Clostridiales bacterium]
MQAVTYKEADPNELPQIAQLYNLLAYELKTMTNDPYFDFETLSDEDTLAALQKAESKIFIAKKENEVIGFISGTVINCFLPVSKVGKIGYIEAAYVIESFRGKGIMSKLENILIEYFKSGGLEFVELNVLSGNLNAKKFWSKSNYTVFREQMRKRI